MADATLVQPTPELIQQFAADMRGDDLAEVLAGGFPDALTAVTTSVELSEAVWAGVYKGKCGAMWGLAPIKRSVLGCADEAQMWFLTAEQFQNYPRAFIRPAKTVLDACLSKYVVLRNLIDARYRKAVMFAQAMGALVHPAVPYGPMNMPFHPFEFRRR